MTQMSENKVETILPMAQTISKRFYGYIKWKIWRDRFMVYAMFCGIFICKIKSDIYKNAIQSNLLNDKPDFLYLHKLQVFT